MSLFPSFSPVVSNHFPTGNPTQTLLCYNILHCHFLLIIVSGAAESQRMLPGSQYNSWPCIWKPQRERPGFRFWFETSEGGHVVELFLPWSVISYYCLLAGFLLHRKVCDQNLCDGWLGWSVWQDLESPGRRDSMRADLHWIGLWVCLWGTVLINGCGKSTGGSTNP